MRLNQVSKFLVLVALLAMLAVSMIGCGDADGAGDGGSLDIMGSDTMVNLSAALAEAYMDKHENVDVVVQGGGSGTGVAALINGTTDVAQMSRAMKEDEWQQAEDQGIEVTEVIAAWDALVVAVHPDNPVNALTLDELGAIYRGEITNWSEVGGEDDDILLLSRDTTSGTHVFFKEAVVQLDGQFPGAEFATDALFLPSTQAIVDELAQSTHAIGYIGIGYYNPDTVQVVAIKVADSSTPVSPIEKHPEGIDYPLSRPLYYYLAGEVDGLVKDFMDFVLGPEGQEVVRSMDFLPIS